jgi:large subunit ribosomal protein L22
MAVKASLRNYRISASKARLVVNQIRGKGVENALNVLDQSDKRFAQPLAKLVRSAVANAEVQNDSKQAGIDIDNLIVAQIAVNEGTSMWRIRPRAQGRATWVQKRTSHVSLELAEK